MELRAVRFTKLRRNRGCSALRSHGSVWTGFEKISSLQPKGKAIDDQIGLSSEMLTQLSRRLGAENGTLSVGAFLRQGLEAYWGFPADRPEVNGVGNWTRNSLEEAIYAMNESVQRTFTSADDLGTLDYNAEREYVMFPGEEITIARGYSSVIESLASVLPEGMIQLGRKVERIQWQPAGGGCTNGSLHPENGHGHESRPVVLHFSDGSTMSADHVIVTVSLGVLKRGVSQDCGMFDPPLSSVKTGAISRLGYGVVNKVFLEVDQESEDVKLPFLQMVFHKPDSEFRSHKIPKWIRRTSFLHPIYQNSRVVLSWFTGEDALELESLPEEEIIQGFAATLSNLLPSKSNHKIHQYHNHHHQNGDQLCNGNEIKAEGRAAVPDGNQIKFGKVMRTRWGSNPLFLGSYSYIAVGSTIDDMDTLAEPLPQRSSHESTPPLQILFAGEATHRTHYSTTHGAYFSGLREANRILKHYSSSTTAGV
ncbi:probable polyamine oxidase 5 isoform X2 [Andrographis paniculata]|uniref:probable polyamine oxidase 5 isoform X2 n=1 Tax=Andrographis paniculata TaxID=175694 RepID=UPI0021E936D7|nr:probable polyamine oxidase 5 isoform X2 [Andrographis paniculata]